MSWDAYVDMLQGQTNAAAIFSVEGALCAKTENFPATPTNLIHWSKMLKDPSLARQHGIPYDKQKLFPLEYTTDYIHAMQDELNIYMKKTASVVVVGLCGGDKPQNDAKNQVLNVAKILTEAGV
ncbi:hypothetical protein TVAG_480180 [Trichomonas vaginalis G3]|uniref:Profilin n=1 Tax=Trichomonas vaginalis (strain ATCC PRA-98 / G3) TaxID=412133 RepID=A2FK28_TRIV3|nr:profilin (actin-binding protein) family [Trichomonas vaginalis G3]EAX94737.1 hypothetical protein TVAG_480180 [Trichomonas vaginalis G3]KAI5551725.1 profilin (actin-binding protein) family [Trichomonas vaginalis G3]|eukprot:XP_001307667.1 hypothetical protein [Trichomonas vaginalis G3]